ncbi:type IV pilus modification PilV family protein [Thermus thermamylovorans]|uniref:type IV pilus modification PilV family protein n=1 Tax=Thermus thermamylovorans TaxID=2509362 RepID=UPI001F3254F9|nr:prepilin-type N-terminal cleavage/methylation domain-containing protein [Thermus thermamylovorans]
MTLIEVLIALSVIGIAFGALLMSQVANLRASAQSRYATDTKAAAVRVLEAKSGEVLWSEIASDPRYRDDPETGRSFHFVDYYYGCPEPVRPPPEIRSGSLANLRPVDCSGTEEEGSTSVEWRIAGEGGILGEGVVTIVVTATHDRGPRVTMGRRVTCYDVYPSPTQDKPAPCPPPGGGR